MKIFSRFETTLFLSVALLFTACKKERKQPEPTPDPTPPAAQVKRIQTDGYNYLSLEWASNVVAKLKMVEDGHSSELAFTYNGDKKPAQATVGNYRLRFVYTGALVSKVEYLVGVNPNEVEGYTGFSYTGNRLSETTYYINTGTGFQPSAKTAYAYYSNGDVKSMTDSVLAGAPNVFAMESRSEYEYDNKPAALQMSEEIFYTLYLNHSAHNVTKQTVYDQNNGLEMTKSYQFEYGSNNLPAKAVETTTATGRPDATKTIIYTY